ncbi:MAG: TetR/AcrR family transcriptional regulator [Hyphomicrobiaceae bacterium]
MTEVAAHKPAELDASVTAIVEDPVLVQKRRSQIVAAATELFSTQGFYKTTIKDIAKLAGISSGLVYQYVREKEDVLLLVLLDVIDAYAREIPKSLVGVDDPIGRLVAAIESYCRVIDRHRDGAVLAYRSTKSLSPPRRLLIQQKESETNALIEAELRSCIRAGLVRKVDLDVLVYHIVMAAHTWALKGWHFKPRLSLDSYIKETTDILMAGALTPSGTKRYAAWMRRRKAK